MTLPSPQVAQSKWIECGYCHAMALGVPPHGEGQPCPLRVRATTAYIESQDAQKERAVGTGMATNDMASAALQAFRRLSGEEAEDDDE